jgi:hypothetical protein
MAPFIVFRVSGTDVPALGQVGSADVYRGDHVDATAAVVAAAAAWRLGPNTFLWVIAQASLTRYITSVAAAAG